MNLLLSILCLALMLQLLYPFVTVLLAQLRPAAPPAVAAPLLGTDFACVITAYKNLAIARPLVDSLLRQTYPTLAVYLVADECAPEEYFTVNDNRFMLLCPEAPLRLKAKSIGYALDRFQRQHDFVVIFDADNLAHPQFLAEINQFVRAGYPCVQGQRTAKNLDTTYAALDSLGEHYKNYVEREVPYRLGGSAVISGSGMATATGLYQAYLNSPEIEEGKTQWKKMLQEDKILQNFLLRRNLRIAYARNALVYDEKVGSGEAVETQRSRWLYSYFQNMPNALGIFRRGLFGGHFNQLYFGFVTLVLPMFIQLGLAFALAMLCLWVAPMWGAALVFAIGVFCLNILWVLHLDAAPGEVWRALWQVPRFMGRQLAALFKMGNPNKHFKHTEHHKLVTLDEIEGAGKAPEKTPPA